MNRVKAQVCPFCLRPLVTENDKTQNLCSDCYDLRRVVRRMWKRQNGENQADRL